MLFVVQSACFVKNDNKNLLFFNATIDKLQNLCYTNKKTINIVKKFIGGLMLAVFLVFKA